MVQVLKINNGREIFLDPRVLCHESETCFLLLSTTTEPVMISHDSNGSIMPSCAQNLLEKKLGSFEKSKIFNSASFCRDIFNWDYSADIDYLYNLIIQNSYIYILDVGCGYGRLFLPLWKKGVNILGVDESLPLVESLNKEIGNNENSYAFCADILDFSIPNKIDFAFSAMNTIRYLESIYNIKKHLITMASSVKPGGCYFFQVTISSSTYDSYNHTWIFSHQGVQYEIRWEKWSYCYNKKQVVDHITVKEIGKEENFLEEYQLQAYLDYDSMREVFDDVKTHWQLSVVLDSNFNPILYDSSTSGNFWFLLKRL